MKARGAIILFILVALSASCTGQERRPESVGTSILQSSDTVAALDKNILLVFQASSGHYWFGSDTQGIYRYDGKVITHYTLKGGHDANRIRNIQEDAQGAVYFASLAGVTKYDGRRFTAPQVVEERASKGWRLTPGDLWFPAPGSGVYRYDGMRVHHLQFPKSPMEDAYYQRNPSRAWSPYEVWTMYKDRSGAVWFGTSNLGACRYDGVSWRWLYEQQMVEVPGGGWFGVRSIAEDAAGRFWFCNTRHRFDLSADKTAPRDTPLIKYKREKGISGYDGDSALYFFFIVEDSTGDLWMSTYAQGVWRYDGKTMNQYSIQDSDNSTTVYSIYQDLQGGLWVGTHNSGVYRFTGRAFEKFSP